MDFVRPVEAIVPGVLGRVLTVLAETTADLNLRTIARLASVSQAQVSRLLPELVSLGIVERREVPPSSLFRLVPEHVASRAILGLARATDTVLIEMGQRIRSLTPPPVSVIVFGSFARGEAETDSDIDVVVIRPDEVAEGDEIWETSIEGWRQYSQRLTGNKVEILEVGFTEAVTKLQSTSALWTDIQRDGRVIHGLSIEELKAIHVG